MKKFLTEKEEQAINILINLTEEIDRICGKENIDYVSIVDKKDKKCHIYINGGLNNITFEDGLRWLQNSYIEYDFIEDE